MNNTVVVEGVELALDGEIVPLPGSRVVDVEGLSKRPEPSKDPLLITCCPLTGDGTFDNSIALSDEVIAEVIVTAL